MKKAFVVIVLFALPIVAYLFFASGVNTFAKLPILTENIGDLDHFNDFEGDSITLSDHITILGFLGEDPIKYQVNAYNIVEKIYDPYYKFNEFQVVILVPKDAKQEVQELKQKLEGITDMRKWNFVYGDEQQLKIFFEDLETDYELREDFSSPYFFIIDKEAALRGRIDDEDFGVLYGYNSSELAQLNNKMVDDVKVILAEYRLALKKYNTKIQD